MVGSDFVEGKAGDVHELDPSGERLGYPPDQVPRRAAEQQEDRLPVRVVGDGAERFEQPGQPLYFVQDDEPLPVSQHPLGRLGQGFADLRPFQIEDDGGAVPVGRDLPCQGGLADLPGAEQSRDRSFGEGLHRGLTEGDAGYVLLNIH